MDPSICVRMKKTDDLFSSFKKYISRDDLFRVLDYINSLDNDKETYGTVTIDYLESSLAGCKIQANLSVVEYYELYDSVKLFKERQENAFS